MSRAHDGGGRDAARASACLAKRAKQQRHAGAFPHTCMSRCGFVFKHECSGLDDDNFLLPPPTNRRTYSYSEPQLYSQNSGGSYFDTQGSSSQVSTVVTSHGMTNNGGGGSGGMTMNLTGGQVISSSPGAYIMDNAAPHPATQTARASPATVSVQAPPRLPHLGRSPSPACLLLCVLPPFALVCSLSWD